ncbi:MAG: S-methyl-5-thioribose-1-phosphate isomerase [Thermoplasmata archaeon]
MKVKTKTGIQDMVAVWMEDDAVKMIDQRYLPEELRLYTAKDPDDIHESIKDMIIRGAPAIGVTAAYGMAQASVSWFDLGKAADTIKSARPTAYDLFYAVDHMVEKIDEGADPLEAAGDYALSIINKCRSIGEHGSKLIEDGSRILTHCNAGALATVDYGTALAPMRVAKEEGESIFVYVDETRPRLQGAKLTAWELFNEDIPHTVIVDNAAGHYMQRKGIDMVIVGTDRIAANGDIANKIGTYEKAVVAKENGIPFYVAAPVTTFDPNTNTGMSIPIEERDSDEVLKVGDKRVVSPGTSAKNPAFDVTPARYITGYITEKGVFSTSDVAKMFD